MYHFYHCYAGGEWFQPATDHINALKRSDLINNLEQFFLGLVGPPEKRLEVLHYFNSYGIDPIVCAEAETGWEQVTLQAMYDFAQSNNGHVLYAHSKGAFQDTLERTNWRRAMIDLNINRWRECIEKLNDNDAVGVHWLLSANKIPFFGGNFWWTHLNIVRSLQRPIMDNRWSPEEWLGTYQSITPMKVFDWKPGWPNYQG